MPPPAIGDDWQFCPRCGARLREGLPRPTCGSCGFAVWINMGVGVAVVVTDAAGRVLLVQRCPGQFGAGLWCLPCGYVEWGEDLQAAAAREALEEAGVEVEIGPVAQVEPSATRLSDRRARPGRPGGAAWAGAP